MTKGVRRWLALGVTALVLGFVTYKFTRSAEWRTFDWNRLWSLLFHANPVYLAAAVALSGTTYLLRALRWKYFLDPIKSASLWLLFVAQVLGFSSIYLIGRPGEVVRPALIARSQDVSFASQLAILLLERIYDVVSMVILFALAFDFQPPHLTTHRAAATLRRVHEGVNSILVLTALLVVGLVLFRLYTETLTAFVRRVFGFLPPKFESALERFLRSLATGLDSIRNWRDLLATLVCTAVLWVFNVSALWMVFRGLGGETAELPWWAGVQSLFFAAVGLMVQLPGIGGGFQVGVIQALRQLFHVRAEAATSAGILSWVIFLAPCLGLGLVALLWEGLTFGRVGDIAREEQKAISATETTTIDH
jgi:glycosyltransferase 2 family protein